ncbi:MAG: restriction endonuclease, partial [Sphingobium yanoikuyae]|nr:restriction endonuclease [Sphingobium yanoikuyae]
MYGLKHVRRRRLEARLASYYAGQGYQVEHPGAPGSRHRFDGCIDLKLWRDGEYILVQCKGWRALQVQRDEVHQLIGLVVSEGATGGILVTFGEFSPGAIDAAA